MKTHKGQIDETWTEVDLTQFKKENPKYADHQEVKASPVDYEQKISVETINKNSILYSLAKTVIKEQGFYTCTLDGKKTLII